MGTIRVGVSVAGGGKGDMISAMSDRPSRASARRQRPGAGVSIDPRKLTWWRNNRLLTRDQLSARIEEVAKERGILDNNGVPVKYSRDAVAKLENGERKPKKYTFEALCAALDCDPEDLQEDFPGTQQTPLLPGLPAPDEVALALCGCTDPIDLLRGKLTTRAWNSVRLRSGCATIGELAVASWDGSLEDTRNLGFVQLAEIRRALAALAAELDEPEVTAEAV